MSSECIIIGGGVIGLLSALELHKAGHKVTLLERGEIGKESSWAGGGILSPLYPWQEPAPLSPLITWGQQFYPAFAEELHQTAGIDPGFFSCGMLVLNINQASLKAAKNWATYNQAPLTLPSHTQVKSEEPHLKIPSEGLTVSLPNVATIRNPRFLRALQKFVLAQGVIIRPHTTAQLTLQESGHVFVTTPHETLKADHVIVASGAWSQQLLEENTIDVKPIKGQMLLFHGDKPLLKHVVISNGHYLIPRRDNRILAGSTLEYCGFDKTTTEQARHALSKVATDLLPTLKDTPIEKHWAGLRPASENRTPYIGKHPKYKNLYFNCGHFRNGFSLAPGSARLLAELITQNEPFIDPTPFAIPS